MDFLNPSKTRANRIRLIIGYILIGIAIALVTAILVFQSYGYDLDRKTGSIIQNGLLFLAAQPEPADIYLNGKQYKSKSDARLVLPSDVYQVELRNAGYRSWKRTISLAGGSIERFVYPFLFPTTITPKTQKTYTAAPSFSTQSPDRHWVLIQEPGKTGVFDEFDANDSKKAAVTVALPEALLPTATKHNLSLVEWSTDNRHVLLKDDADTGAQFIMLDRETPASSYNVNKTFPTATALSEVALRDKHFDQLYLYNQNTHKLDLGDSKDGSVKPVLSNVLAFKSHGPDLILFATDDKAVAGKTRIMLRDTDGSYLIREVTASPRYLLDLAQYSGHWHVAVGGSADNTVFIYKDPQDTMRQPNAMLLPETALRITDPNWMEFSANTQFIALENGPRFAVYDFENQRSYKYDTRITLDTAAPHATWMDGDRLLVSAGGMMNVFDYDGINSQSLTPNQPGLLPFFDRQYKLMYTVAPHGDGGSALERTNLVVGQNN